jgi:hypothetical protein
MKYLDILSETLGLEREALKDKITQQFPPKSSVAVGDDGDGDTNVISRKDIPEELDSV